MNPYDPRYMLLQEEKLRSLIKKEKSVVCISKELNVSRQTIHKWLNRYKRYGPDGLVIRRKKQHRPAHNRTPKEIELLVENIAKEYYADGVEALGDRIKCKYNITLHSTTIYRILKRNDIRYTPHRPRTTKRWKKKLYAHKIPGTELQMDTKYPFGYKQGKVIYTVIDDTSRWVHAYCYTKANKENTIDFLKKVLKKAPFLIQKIRADNGKEFIANNVKNFLKKQQITYRLNTPYCPEENGKIERFHRTLNEKCLRYAITPKDTVEYTQYQLTLFLHYYNYQKKHRGLGMEGMTPLEKLQEKAGVNLTVQCYNY